MRAMSEHRKATGIQASTPEQVLEIVKSLGYEYDDQKMSQRDQVRLFTLAMERYKSQQGVSHPSCSDVINVIETIGFSRSLAENPTFVSGLPIDRRRCQEDDRTAPAERRASLEPSAQELLDLTDEENLFLDRLKELRESTGRAFASSEEILSIVWSLGYRPASESGLCSEWLDEDDRCRKQAQFTDAVEKRVAADVDGEYLTCRSLLEIIDQIGFRLP